MGNFVLDPEYWKKSTYSTLWGKHMNNVQQLNFTLLSKFPKLNGCIKEGHGAKSDKWLKIPPEEKNEPDLNLYKDYICFCHIEVSGSDKVNMPNNLWIRPGKIDTAENHPEPYFFYLVYPNETRIIEIKEAKRYRNNTKKVHIKKDPVTNLKIPEIYCEIPYEATQPIQYLYDFIDKEINPQKNVMDFDKLGQAHL